MTAEYLGRHPEEREALLPLLGALARPADPTSRKTYPGHITCSAIAIDRHDRVLHIHHSILDKDLAPGGHIESVDTTLPGAALRELQEETDILSSALLTLNGYEDIPLDINVHNIAANPSRGEPAHQHYDFRFAFRLLSERQIHLQAEEVTDYRWLPFAKVTAPTIARKLALLGRSMSF
ncbi:NUDIX hydrolase [Streptomyces nigrescens]|uniref:NUDIX hydrolase n=1 Tax=Streptomyces nigrescens TaxID=1920 RepID=UPI001FD077FE|nr:NUDIX domain-containing protein [Streptomyces libani]